MYILAKKSDTEYLAVNELLWFCPELKRSTYIHAYMHTCIHTGKRDIKCAVTAVWIVFVV